MHVVCIYTLLHMHGHHIIRFSRAQAWLAWMEIVCAWQARRQHWASNRATAKDAPWPTHKVCGAHNERGRTEEKIACARRKENIYTKHNGSRMWDCTECGNKIAIAIWIKTNCVIKGELLRVPPQYNNVYNLRSEQLHFYQPQYYMGGWCSQLAARSNDTT